jgi:hypothetical protein
VRSNSLFEGTDFKLAACDRPLNDKVAKECGFNALSIRVVQVIMILFFFAYSLSMLEVFFICTL